MASVIPRPGGHHWIQLRVGAARHTIRLGKCSRKDAESIRVKIEALAVAVELGTDPDVETTTWLARCGDKLHKRITATGLAHGRPRVRDVAIGAFAAAFLADYAAGDKGTLATIRTAFLRIRKLFGDDKIMRRISEADAIEARRSLEDAGYSEATISTTIKKVRQLWSEALARGLVSVNVWLGVRTGDQRNQLRAYFITAADTAKLLAAVNAADHEWRLMIALCRFGGLRFPSEHHRLRRGDIDWARDRFKVRGKGKRDRWVPIFPELRPHLAEAVAAVAPDATYLLARHRRGISAAALRRQFKVIVAAAGLTPWPRLFHNLRASRQTELVAAGHPEHVVAAWLGNSEETARRHYLQVTEEDFARAANAPPAAPEPPQKAEVISEEPTASNRRRQRGTAG